MGDERDCKRYKAGLNRTTVATTRVATSANFRGGDETSSLSTSELKTGNGREKRDFQAKRGGN